MHTPSSNPATELSDAELVRLSRGGDHGAFGQIVERYQSLVCALAYSACGNVAQSEDIAQEVFVGAWKQLGRLREPGRLKEWLCGIARHTSVQTYRRARREPAQIGAELGGEDIAPEPQPSEQAIRREEESLLWRALARLPGTYREALVLYYREHRSIEHVAVALDLSEENVRQRLSRGRKALQDEVAGLLARTLTDSAPGPAFREAVLGALPLSSLGGAAAAAKGGVVKAGLFAGVAGLSGLILPLIGMFIQLREARTVAERRQVISIWTMLWLGCTVFLGGLFAAQYVSRNFWSAHPHGRAEVLISACAVYILIFGLFVWKCMTGSWRVHSWMVTADRKFSDYEYRSRLTLLGLPLIHICYLRRADGRAVPAKGWIAIGKIAYGGAVACGTLAVAPIAAGALCIGLVSSGCIAAGGLAVGSIAVGAWALGGIAAGWLAWGGCALGLHAAMGAAVWARDFGIGNWTTTIAAHANGPIARRAIYGMFFFRHAEAIFALGVLASWLPFILSFAARCPMRRKSHGTATPLP